MLAADGGGNLVSGSTDIARALVTLATVLVLLAVLLLIRYSVQVSKGAPYVIGGAIVIGLLVYWVARNPDALDAPIARTVRDFF
jgi:hypothetical protein